MDEISNRKQTEAARTISQRGVACIATVHGDGLASIIIDPERKELMGGIESGVLISDMASTHLYPPHIPGRARCHGCSPLPPLRACRHPFCFMAKHPIGIFSWSPNNTIPFC